MNEETHTQLSTITLPQKDQDDTLKQVQVTDRKSASRSHDLREKKERTEVRVDTVYVEKQSENAQTVVGQGVAID